MQLSDGALAVLEARYLREGETPTDLFHRVDNAVAQAEDVRDRDYWANAFYNLMEEGKFLPNSPTLVNAGLPKSKGCLSACFVVSPDDHMESILQVQKDWGMIEKWGGGVGMGLSSIRPKNDTIQTTHGKALGPVAIMRMYAANSDEITQGSFRRGAHMAQLVVTHPDIREFIHCKDDDSLRLSGFNISVQIPDSFMKAVQKDQPWSLINPKDGTVWNVISAKELWNEICTSAWKTGDPGVVFIDRVHETAPNPFLGPIRSSNPCGEEFLEEYGNCCLGSINLSKYYRNDVDKSGQYLLDEQALSTDIFAAVRFLDNVIEVNTFPIERLREVNLSTRRIGLGVMGWADALAKMGIRYDSEAALTKADEVASFFCQKAWEASAYLAEIRGPFPHWAISKITRKVRHSSVFTIAPTGTISMIAGCSSGIEPYYALAWWRNTLWSSQAKAEKRVLEYPPGLLEFVDIPLLEKVANGDVEAKETVLFASAFQTAHDVSPEAHVKMLAAWQKHVTNSVSKTINLVESASIDDVRNAFSLAWTLRCKAVTVYRDGSKRLQVLETKKADKLDEQLSPTPHITLHTRERPRIVEGLTEKVKTGHGTLYATINFNGDGEQPFEVFGNLGKSGGCDSAYLEAISRLASLALRSGVEVTQVVKQLRGITCHPTWDEKHQIMSPADAIGFALEGCLAKGTKVESGITPRLQCPACSGQLVQQEGCATCQSCGWKAC